MFLEGSYSYRKLSVLVIGAILTPACLIPLFLLWANALSEKDWNWTAGTIATATVLTAVLGVLGFVGLWCLHAFVTRRENIVFIDEHGITNGNRHNGWAEMAVLGAIGQARAKNGNTAQRVQLVYQLRSGFKKTQPVMIDQFLGEEAFVRLMGALRKEVSPKFPDLKM